MTPDDFKPSDFDGCIRLYQTSQPRDVAPGRVPVQILATNGTVWRECELTESIVAQVAALAAEAGFTIEQMLARVILEVLWQKGGAF